MLKWNVRSTTLQTLALNFSTLGGLDLMQSRNGCKPSQTFITICMCVCVCVCTSLFTELPQRGFGGALCQPPAARSRQTDAPGAGAVFDGADEVSDYGEVRDLIAKNLNALETNLESTTCVRVCVCVYLQWQSAVDRRDVGHVDDVPQEIDDAFTPGLGRVSHVEHQQRLRGVVIRRQSGAVNQVL